MGGESEAAWRTLLDDLANRGLRMPELAIVDGARARKVHLHPLPEKPVESIRTSNAIERLHEEFKRRIKTQTVLPSAETAAMLFWLCWLQV